MSKRQCVPDKLCILPVEREQAQNRFEFWCGLVVIVNLHVGLGPLELVGLTTHDYTNCLHSLRDGHPRIGVELLGYERDGSVSEHARQLMM